MSKINPSNPVHRSFETIFLAVPIFTEEWIVTPKHAYKPIRYRLNQLVKLTLTFSQEINLFNF